MYVVLWPSGYTVYVYLFISRITTMCAIYVPEKKRISYSLVELEYNRDVRNISFHLAVVCLAIMHVPEERSSKYHML